MSGYDVYAIGNALVDLEYSVGPDRLTELGIEKGVMTLVDADEQSRLMAELAAHEVHRSAGGSAANTVIAVSQFGGRGFYSCRIADDELGHVYADDLRANGVATNAHEQREAGSTGRCLVLVTPDADRTMQTYLGITGNLEQDVLDPDALKSAQYLYLEGYLATSDSARKTVARARDTARQAGVRTALSLSDPNIVHYFRDGLEEMIGPGLDMIFCNEDEALGISGAASLEAAIEWLKGVAREFVMTRGPQGALIWDGNRLLPVPARNVEPLDTVGAGDMFAGAFLYGLARGWDHGRAGELAVAASGRIITEYGPRLTPTAAKQVLTALPAT